jgi:quercetin dioxygenase-like cupin family protein
MQASAEAVRAPAATHGTHVNERPGRSSALGLMAGGLAVLVLAGGLLATVPQGAGHHHTRTTATRTTAAPSTATTGVPGALTIQSTGDITVLNMTYEPGQSSGWHRHRGIHAVAVISGQLTVYDQNCVAHTYGPGDAYIGGQLPHLVRNEGGEPATMVVTYVNPIGPAPAQVAPTTAPCDVR